MSVAASWSRRRPSSIVSRMRPVADDQHAVGVGGRLRVVGDEHDRLVPLLARAPQRVEDLGAGRVVEVAGRLVGEEQRRAGHERTGDRDALLLAGRQLVGLVVLLAGQVDELDHVADALGDLAARRVLAGDRERQGDVLGHVEERDEVERLEDEPGPVAAQPRGPVVGQLADDLALEDRPRRSSGRSRPPSSWRSVLLPLPDGPMSATNSPAATDRETPRSASTVVSPSGYDLVRSRAFEDRARSRRSRGRARLSGGAGGAVGPAGVELRGHVCLGAERSGGVTIAVRAASVGRPDGPGSG